MRIVLLSYHKVVVWSRIHFCFVQYLGIFKWKLLGKYKNTTLCKNEVCVLCALVKGTWLISVGLILEKADFYLGFKYQSALIEAFIEQGHEALEGPCRDQIKCFLAKAFLQKGEFLMKNAIIPKRTASHSFSKTTPPWTCMLGTNVPSVSCCTLYTCFPSLDVHVSALNFSLFCWLDAFSNLVVKMIWFLISSFPPSLLPDF